MASIAQGNSTAASTGAAVRIEDLQFRWPGEEGFGVHVGGFEIRRGEKVLLMGPSGGGKTTLLSLICGIALPLSGKVQILGSDTRKLSGPQRDRFRADHFGIVFQMFNLLPFATIADNVKLPLSFSPARRNRIGDAAAIETEVNRLLDALDLPAATYAERAASDLSVGQQQRVAAARALIGAPEILVADEPTSALDGQRQREFLGLLMDQVGNTGSTLLFASHDDRIADHFDRVLTTNQILNPLAPGMRS